MCCYGLNQPLFPSKNKFGRIILGIVRLSAERILAKSEKWGVFGQILIWTGDKKLFEGLKAKGYNEVIDTDGLSELRDELEKNRK